MKRKETNLTEIDGKLYARVGYKDPRTGKWKSKYKRVQTKAEGRAQAVELRRQYSRPRAEQLDAEKMTFNDLLDAFPRKFEKYFAEMYREYFGAMKLRAIDYTTLKAFREKRETVKHRYTDELRCVATINREMEILRRLFNYAAQEDWITRNPFKQGEALIKLNEEVPRDRIPTDDEINRLLDHATGPRRHLRVLIFAALDTGLRRGKLLRLKRPQIDLENRLLDLGRPTARNKRHPRFVGITERLARELAAWLEERNRPTVNLFLVSGTIFKRAGRSFVSWPELPIFIFTICATGTQRMRYSPDSPAI